MTTYQKTWADVDSFTTLERKAERLEEVAGEALRRAKSINNILERTVGEEGEEEEISIEEINEDLRENEEIDEDGNIITEEMREKAEVQADIAMERDAEELSEKRYEEAKQGVISVGSYA